MLYKTSMIFGQNFCAEWQHIIIITTLGLLLDIRTLFDMNI